MKLLHMPLLALLALTLIPTTSVAKKVYSPTVEQGELEFETQSEVYHSKNVAKNNSGKHQIEIAYSFTDVWHSGIYVVYQKPSDSTLDYNAAKWSNIFQMTDTGKYWLDIGLYAEYIWTAPKLNAPDILELKVLLEKLAGLWKHTFNAVYKKALESNTTPASLSYAWLSRYKMESGLEPAIEVYGTLGTTDDVKFGSYLIGPALEFNVSRHFEMNVAWVMDSVDGPAYGVFKLNMEYEF